jgi:hypothetical protein
LWDKYTAYKAQSLEQTTIQTTFRRVRNTITEYGDKPIIIKEDAHDVKCCKKEYRSSGVQEFRINQHF